MKMTKKAREFVSKKIVKLHKEGKSPKQAIAIALDMARKKRMKVPKR